MPDTLKCKICKKDFPARAGLEKLRVCEACDDDEKAGIAMRAHVQVVQKGTKQMHIPRPLWTAPGFTSLTKEDAV